MLPGNKLLGFRHQPLALGVGELTVSALPNFGKRRSVVLHHDAAYVFSQLANTLFAGIP